MKSKLLFPRPPLLYTLYKQDHIIKVATRRASAPDTCYGQWNFTLDEATVHI